MTATIDGFRIPNAAWSGHFLVLADESVVEGTLRRPMLSPSIASGYNGCPARTALDRLMPRVDDPFAAHQLGNVFHPIMEDIYRLPPQERTLERALGFLRKRGDEQWSVTKLEKQNAASLAANLENRKRWEDHIAQLLKWQFILEDPTKIEVAGIEDLLDAVEIGAGVGAENGIPLKGYVDRTDWIVLADGTKRRGIRDYKTGKAKMKVSSYFGDDYGDQLRIYAEGYLQKTGERPAEALLLFPRGLENVVLDDITEPLARKLTVRSIDLSPDAMRKTLLGFRAGWNTMNDSCDRRTFEARPSALCGWCPAANSCPVANVQSAGARAAAESQPSALQLGIPHLRPGASLQDVREAPGVTVPVSRGPDFDTPIPPAGAELFPVTIFAEGEQATPTEPSHEVEHAIPDEIAAPDEAEELSEQIFEASEHFYTTQDPLFPHPDDPFAEERADAVHVDSSAGEHPDNESENQTMSEREQPLTVKAEAAPYEAEINGSLNLNSYAAMSVCGLVAQAAQHLHNQGAKLSPASINRFAHVLAGIVMRVQRTTTGLSNFQSGANTRLRGFLFTALEMWPAPFLVPTSDGAHRVPASLDQWKAWIDRVESFLHAALASAVDVYDSAQEQIAARPESFFAEGGDGAANHIAVTAVR